MSYTGGSVSPSELAPIGLTFEAGAIPPGAVPSRLVQEHEATLGTVTAGGRMIAFWAKGNEATPRYHAPATVIQGIQSLAQESGPLATEALKFLQALPPEALAEVQSYEPGAPNEPMPLITGDAFDALCRLFARITTPPSRRHAAPARPLPPITRFPSNTVHGATVRALARFGEWAEAETSGFLRIWRSKDYRGLETTFALPESALTQELWRHLRQGGPRLVKAHYALWARWFEEGAPDAGYLTVSINQFCADLGYRPAAKGGYKKERKQEAMRLLQTLTNIEMAAICTLPNGKSVRLRGPLWNRGLLAEEQDRYADLFGNARAGDPDLWEPVAFSYAPGAWFQEPEWRKYNRAIGKIGAGLLKLAPDEDAWPILIGGYLGAVIRANAYAPLRLRAATILNAVGLVQTRDLRRRASQYRDKFERALDRLVEVGVLGSWHWDTGAEATELSDPDDPEAIADYYAEDDLPPGDWRKQIVILTLPPEYEPDAERLANARQKAITDGKRRRGRPRKNPPSEKK